MPRTFRQFYMARKQAFFERRQKLNYFILNDDDNDKKNDLCVKHQEEKLKKK